MHRIEPCLEHGSVGQPEGVEDGQGLLRCDLTGLGNQRELDEFGVPGLLDGEGVLESGLPGCGAPAPTEEGGVLGDNARDEGGIL